MQSSADFIVAQGWSGDEIELTVVAAAPAATAPSSPPAPKPIISARRLNAASPARRIVGFVVRASGSNFHEWCVRDDPDNIDTCLEFAKI